VARDAEFDFSYPIMQSGLQIMVPNTGRSGWSESPMGDMVLLLFSRTTLVWLGMALLLVLIPAHLVWLFERRYEGGIVKNRSYFPGLFEAVYWAMSTLTAQAESMPRHWVGRAFSVFWMFAGVVFVAFYTAQLTTVLTVQQIRGTIEGPRDLPGKRVGTITGSVALDYLREHDAHVQEFQTGEQMFQALIDKEVEAVVIGAPVLRYFAEHQGKGRVRVVGPEFDPGPIAIMLQLNSPLRRRFDSALLVLRESGTYQQIYRKWFGSP
jgi:polar amino acid transport system substrate-binding protein